MAATIGATPDVRTIRLTFLDEENEDFSRVVTVDGSTADAVLEDMFDALDAVCQPILGTPSISNTQLVTGLNATPGSAAYNLVANQGYMTFQMAHPLNASKTVEKMFVIPGITKALVLPDRTLDIAASSPTPPTTDPERLRFIVDALEANLSFQAINGTWYTGFSLIESGLLTVNSVVDGL